MALDLTYYKIITEILWKYFINKFLICLTLLPSTVLKKGQHRMNIVHSWQMYFPSGSRNKLIYWLFSYICADCITTLFVVFVFTLSTNCTFYVISEVSKGLRIYIFFWYDLICSIPYLIFINLSKYDLYMTKFWSFRDAYN